MKWTWSHERWDSIEESGFEGTFWLGNRAYGQPVRLVVPYHDHPMHAGFAFLFTWLAATRFHLGPWWAAGAAFLLMWAILGHLGITDGLHLGKTETYLGSVEDTISDAAGAFLAALFLMVR